MHAKVCLLLAIVAGAMASSSSSSSSSSPSSWSFSTYVIMPGSISYELYSVSSLYPSIYTIGSTLSVFELSNPSFIWDESCIESYEWSSSSLVSFFESYAEYTSQITDYSEFQYYQSQYSSLFTAVASLMSAEATCSNWRSRQQNLQSAMQTDSSILTDLAYYTEYYYPSVYSDSVAIGEATFTDTSFFADYLSLYTDLSEYSSIGNVLSELSYSLYYLPSSVVSYMACYISSRSTMSPSDVTYLKYSYPMLFQDLQSVESFTSSHSSIDSALTNYFFAASSVSSIGSAAYTIISSELPTLTYEVSVLSAVYNTWYSMSSDLSFVDALEVTSSSLSSALDTMEETFYNSYAVAYELFYAIKYPYLVTDTSSISYLEMSHQSFVSALNEVIGFESEYSEYSRSFSSILSYLTCAWATQSTLLTAYSYLSAAESSSTALASVELSTLYSIDSSWSSVLSYISSALYNSPSLSSDESIIESYAYSYSSIVSSLWSVITDLSAYTSSVSYYSSLEASYSNLVSALESVYYSISSSLESDETYFISLASADSTVLSEYSSFSSATSSFYEFSYSQSSSSFSSFSSSSSGSS